jgi:hypothetical protein
VKIEVLGIRLIDILAPCILNAVERSWMLLGFVKHKRGEK